MEREGRVSSVLSLPDPGLPQVTAQFVQDVAETGWTEATTAAMEECLGRGRGPQLLPTGLGTGNAVC